MAQLAISSGKLEYDNNLDNFTVANENWVLNLINKINPCNIISILSGNKGVNIPAGLTSQRDSNSPIATVTFNTEL